MVQNDVQYVSSLYGGFWDFDVKDFNYLTNPYFPPAEFLQSMGERLIDLVKSYPSTNWYISSLIAETLGLTENEVVVANGASELISVISRRFMTNLAVPIPTFDEYPNRARDQGALVNPYQMVDPFHLDVEGFVRHVKATSANTALVITPNNPTGGVVARDGIVYLLESLRDLDLVLIDESFLDFADLDPDPSALGMINEFENLIIIKSLSKVCGVPGLRLGYAVSGDPEKVRNMRGDVPIWSINSLAQYFLSKFGSYQSQYAESCDSVKCTTKSLFDDLGDVPYLKPYPTQANFVLCRVFSPLDSTELTTRLFDGFRILINDCSRKTGLDNQFVRIASCSAEQNAELIVALQKIAESVPTDIDAHRHAGARSF